MTKEDRSRHLHIRTFVICYSFVIRASTFVIIPAPSSRNGSSPKGQKAHESQASPKTDADGDIQMSGVNAMMSSMATLINALNGKLPEGSRDNEKLLETNQLVRISLERSGSPRKSWTG